MDNHIHDDGQRCETVRLDATALAILAHPLRSRLLGALRLDGPATATELATRFQTNTGATSYHLRKLAAVGLVDDAGTGTGRRRVWQASTRYTSWEPSAFAGDPQSQAALAWLERHHFDHLTTLVHSWHDAETRWPVAWQDAAGMGDDILTVTPDQLKDFTAELWELLRRHRDAGVGHPDARRVALHVLSIPLDIDEVPE